jgi:DNA primase
MKSRGVSEELLVRAGLVVRRNDGKTYDRFRERVMIPIKDARGRVVGFTGRILGAAQPKYLNTGETDVFTKRSLLFGMDVALKAAREKRQIIVVEGHMDAIRLHASGIIWTVASMGTAFTEQHAGQIARAVPEVVFAFDNDEAGLKAAMDAIPLALKAGLEVKVLVVPKGKDPDDFIRSEGPEAFLNLLGKAPSGIDFQIERTLKQNNFSGLEGKVKTVSNIYRCFSNAKRYRSRQPHTQFGTNTYNRRKSARRRIQKNQIGKRSSCRTAIDRRRKGKKLRPGRAGRETTAFRAD